jgi:hypothetical protein
LDDWRVCLEQALVRAGVPAGRSNALALLMMSALEGALVLARTQEDLAALDSVIDELCPLLDAAAAAPPTPHTAVSDPTASNEAGRGGNR